MSGHHHGERGLYKDTEEGWFLGVCAGIARYFDLSRTGVRIVVGLSLLFMFWPTLIAYVVAGFVLRNRPLCYCGRDERRFWREHSHH